MMKKDFNNKYIDLLLEEWKQNVALYIDQDKRGLERIKMFLTVQAGLFILYGAILGHFTELPFVVGGCLISLFSIVFAKITWKMSKRAHAFIILRVVQCIIIEEEISKKCFERKDTNQNDKIELVLSTFTRENIAFANEDNISPKYVSLKQRLQIVNSILKNHPTNKTKKKEILRSDPFYLKNEWESSMSHLK